METIDTAGPFVAAFSASSQLFDLNGEVNKVRKKQSSTIIADDV
jgi:hypothetical protein